MCYRIVCFLLFMSLMAFSGCVSDTSFECGNDDSLVKCTDGQSCCTTNDGDHYCAETCI